MSIQQRYIKQSILWWNDKQEVIYKIGEALDKARLVKNWDEKTLAHQLIEEELTKYVMHREWTQEEKPNRIGWRIAYLLLIVFQWLLWPYCAYRWFRTGNFHVDANSKLGNFINRIVTEAN